MGVDASADEMYRIYCDPSHPFGHERVLYMLLALHGMEEELPWWRYYREHSDVYRDVCHV